MHAISYWASRGRTKIGPYPTREAAVAAFIAAHPVKNRTAGTLRRITSGGGSDGPYFDLRWHNGFSGEPA